MDALIWNPVHSQMLSGDIAKNFKNEAPRHKDLASLRNGASQPEYTAAMYLAREALQNSVDSARDREFRAWKQAAAGQGPGGEEGGPFEVTFRFVKVLGEEKTKLERRLGIAELRDLVEANTTEWLGGSPSPEVRGALKRTSSNQPLTLLFIEEHSSSGMYSRNEGDLTESKMLIAMYSHNISDKDGTGSGGSFGHGKSALAAASLMRMNVAYSNYAWRGDDGAALLGVAYYPMHRRSSGEAKMTGFAFIADGCDAATGFPKPLLRADAHEAAAKLGFTPRLGAGDSGTSMMIVAPAFDAEKLEQAVADHWWPAICSGQLKVNLVEEVRGGHVPTEPTSRLIDPADYSKHPGLQGFPEALGDMLAPAAPEGLLWPFPSSGTFAARIVSSSTRPRAQASGSASRHIVAHARSLGMVAFYRRQQAGSLKGQREIRGIFLVTDEKANELFRLSEPKTHDEWVKNASGLPETDRRTLRDLHLQMSKGIREAVAEIVASERASDGEAKSSELLGSLLGPLLRPGRAPDRKNKDRAPVGPLRVEALGRSNVDEAAGEVTLQVRVTHDLGADEVSLKAVLSAASEGGSAPEWLPTGVTVDGDAVPVEIMRAAGGVFTVKLSPQAAPGGALKSGGPSSAVVGLAVSETAPLSQDDLSDGSARVSRPLHSLWTERLRPEWRVEVEG